MTFLEALILGIIQGATEFLPISSSGHSILLPTIFGLSQPTSTAVVIAHQGTLVAVLIYFWKDIWAIIRGFLRGLQEKKMMASAESRLGWYILAGSIPAAVIGLMFEDAFETRFATPRWAAFFLLFTALFLVIGEKLLSGKKKLSQMSWSDAWIIGFAQMFALFPGVSRSGSTIMAGLARGLDRKLAARYSFLLGIPAIGGAGLLKLKSLIGADVPANEWLMLFVTFAVSGLVGYACIHFLLQWLRKRSLYPFAIYCAAFGSLYLLFSFL